MIICITLSTSAWNSWEVESLSFGDDVAEGSFSVFGLSVIIDASVIDDDDEEEAKALVFPLINPLDTPLPEKYFSLY